MIIAIHTIENAILKIANVFGPIVAAPTGRHFMATFFPGGKRTMKFATIIMAFSIV